MSTLLPTLAAAGPLAAGWSVHALWARRRLDAARRDPLTGLHTRAGFEERARRALGRGPHAVLVIDLDGFKQINDAYGHAAGDEALISAAAALGELADGRDAITARLGGDEFAAVVPLPGPTALPWLLEGLHGCLTAPLACQGLTLTVGASAGGVHAPAGTDLAAALRVADEAMYTAKRAGGGWRTADLDDDRQASVNGRRAGRGGTHASPSTPMTSGKGLAHAGHQQWRSCDLVHSRRPGARGHCAANPSAGGLRPTSPSLRRGGRVPRGRRHRGSEAGTQRHGRRAGRMTAPTTTMSEPTGATRPGFSEQAAAVMALAALVQEFGHLPGVRVGLDESVPDRVEIRLHPSRTYGPDTLSGFEAWREALGIDPGAVTQDAVGGTGWLEAHTEWRGVLLRLTAFYDVPWGGERS